MAELRSACVRRLGAVALALALSAPPAAHAQTWLAPADATATLLGPERAKGAVIWSHGRSANAEGFEAPTPPYIMTLSGEGWDVFRFNRMRIDDVLDPSTAALVRQVSRLKRQGYRRVALAGQSFGAFLSLMVADASDEVDAVVATAPAAYGRSSGADAAGRRNATQLYPLLAQIRRARVMIFYFRGDAYDPGGRGARSRLILADHHIEHVVVDQPPALDSHWAASTALFQRQFGGCVLAFLDTADPVRHARCDGDRLRAAASLAPAASRSTGG